MDHVDHDRGGVAFRSLSSRIRELPRQLAKRIRLARPKKSHARKLKAAAFVFLAILFGTIAHRLNREETELGWRKSHIPSAEIWAASFSSAGFHSVSNPYQVARITRKLPSLADVTGEIWNASPDWWAVETRDGQPPLVFCSRCALKAPPTGWRPMGNGWDGWDVAIKAARQEALALLSANPPARRGRKTRSEAFDPREIRY